MGARNRRMGLLRFEQVDELLLAVNTGFEVDILHMEPDGVFGDGQLVAYERYAPAFQDQADDVRFAFGERKAFDEGAIQVQGGMSAAALPFSEGVDEAEDGEPVYDQQGNNKLLRGSQKARRVGAYNGACQVTEHLHEVKRPEDSAVDDRGMDGASARGIIAGEHEDD